MKRNLRLGVMLACIIVAPLAACGGDTAGADTTIADTTVADTMVADTTVADTTVADTTVADTTVADTTVADTTVADTTVADTTVADTTVADTTVADTAVADTTVPDDVTLLPPAATLIIDDQTLTPPFDTIVVTLAEVPSDATAAGTLRIRLQGGERDGDVIGTKLLSVGTLYEDYSLQLLEPVVGNQALSADIIDPSQVTEPGLDGEPLIAQFTVVGDTVDPELVMHSQEVDPDDLYGLVLASAVVPARFSVGVWVAIYEDDGGQPATLRGKVQLQPGEHTDVAFSLTSKLAKGQTLHAIMREGRPGSGSWSSSNPVITDLAGLTVSQQFFVDSEAFRPVLEVDDQTLVEADELIVKKVTMPKEYIGGGWVAIYADDSGAPGALIGKLQYTTGTKEDRTVQLTVPQEGDKTLHAMLHVGQLWDDAKDHVMVAPGGGEMALTFKVGAQSLSYIVAPKTVTDDPRHVVVQRAYSFDKPAWVVLARDDNGQPGTVLARKKVLKKFAGNVHLHWLYGDFLTAGTTAEYLVGTPDTYRRCVRGDETLHVLLYEDDPADSEFTWTPGGSEDVPVLDADGKQVTARLEVEVRSSVQNTQKDSPRYYNPCPLSQHIGNPTALPVDCRCHVDVVSLAFPECKSIIADHLDMSFGEGPRPDTHGFGVFRSGYPEPATNELVTLMVWKDAQTRWPENQTTLDVGAVVAVHAETGDRTVVGGRYEDPNSGIIDVGTGPVLSYPFEVQKGPDDKIYVASYGYVRLDASLVPTVDIIRMDPATGDREYAWRSNHLGFNLDNEPNPWGHCANGRTEKYGYWSVQIGRKAFGIDPQGNFYLSYAHNGNTPTSDGIGIIKVSADGKSCDFVTRTKVGADNVLYQGQSVGAGIEPQAGPYKGMLVKDGKLYVSTALDDDLYEIDIASGDRKALHVETDDTVSGSSGTHVVWDPYRDLIWQAGLSGATLLYDPVAKTSTPLWCPENYRDYKGISCVRLAAWGNNGMPMERGIWMHPTDGDYVFVPAGPMIQRVHLKSGTSEIFSY